MKSPISSRLLRTLCFVENMNDAIPNQTMAINNINI